MGVWEKRSVECGSEGEVVVVVVVGMVALENCEVRPLPVKVDTPVRPGAESRMEFFGASALQKVRPPKCLQHLPPPKMSPISGTYQETNAEMGAK